MELADYLLQNRITIEALAKSLGYTRKMISEVIHKRRYPSYRLAKAIEDYTQGHVTAISLLNPKKI